MKYLLVVGFACDVYRQEPRARVFIDDKLIDEYFIAPYKSSLEDDKKVLFKTLLYPTSRKEMDNLFFKNMPLLKFYEINIDREQNKLNLLIEINNNDNNYNNGFLSKSTLIQLKVCYFFPLHKKLLERIGKKMSKNITGKNHAWTRRQTNMLFDLVKNGMEWHGKNKQIFKSESNSELDIMTIGGDGYFSCDLKKKYGIFIKNIKKPYMFRFATVYINYFINKYEQYANKRNIS